MRRLSPFLLALLAAAGCKPVPQEEAAVAAKPATLLGVWKTEAPVRYMGEALRTEGEGQTEYKPDGRFHYAGKLTVQGDKLPPDGLAFQVSGEGKWMLIDRTLSEDFTSVEARPEAANATLSRLGRQLAKEMVDQPPSVSLIDLRTDRLTLRDRDSGQEAHYIRLR